MHPPSRGLRVVPVGGGISSALLAEPLGGLAVAGWWDDETVIFSERGSLYRVAAVGGAVDTLLHRDGGGLVLSTRVADTDWVLATDVVTRRIVAFELGADSTHTVVADAAGGRYVSETGHLVYGNSRGQLFASPFDVRRAVTTGDPVPLLEGLSVMGGIFPKYSLSATGTLVYNVGGPNESDAVMQRLVEHSFDGAVRRIPLPGRLFSHVRWSPDGRTLAFAALEPGELLGLPSIYTYDAAQDGHAAAHARGEPGVARLVSRWPVPRVRRQHRGRDSCWWKHRCGR